ncbi:Pelota-like_protein [Hexamita inflata]|uniref:Pelota-like protein n=1 Tax=Hexamita inflata TaxID=28002 RepID=A0AA86Q0G7_9EUKA|nr:Pelota-like protein [Hexamita inflata]
MKLHHIPTEDSPELAVTPQNESDLYLLSKTIKVNDIIASVTTRKVQATESKSVRKTLYLKLKVMQIAYKQQDMELVITGKVTEGKEDVSVGQTHTIHIYVYHKVTVTKQQWYKADVDEVISYADAARNAQQAAILLTRDGVGRFAFTEENQFMNVERVERAIPQKNAFNQSKIQSAQGSFLLQVIVFLQQKLTVKIKTLVVMGQSDILEHFKSLDLKSISCEIQYHTTKELTFSKAFASIQEQGNDELFQEFKKRLELNAKWFCATDCLKCANQNLAAISDLLMLKSEVSGNNRDQIEQIMQQVKQTKDIKVQIIADNTDLGQKLKNFGGMICLVKYDVYLDVEDTKAGQEFQEWEKFDEIEAEM